MSDKDPQSKTTEAPKDKDTSQLVAPAPNVPRLVKIRALLPIMPSGQVKGQEQIVAPGTVLEVTEEDAKEFCDRIFVGNYGMSGMFPEQQAELTRHRIKRAERVA